MPLRDPQIEYDIDKHYGKEWQFGSIDVYTKIAEDGNLAVLKYIHQIMPTIIPYDHVAIGALSKKNMDIFQWTITRLQNYRFVAKYAAQYGCLEAVEFFVNHVSSRTIDKMIDILNYHGHKHIAEWLSKDKIFPDRIIR